MEDKNLNNVNTVDSSLEQSKTKAIDENTKKALEKKKSNFRLFWLFIVLDIAIAIYIIYLVIDIFVDVAKV